MGACFLYGKTGGYTGYTLPEFTYTGQYEKFQVAVAAAPVITVKPSPAAEAVVTRRRRKA